MSNRLDQVTAGCENISLPCRDLHESIHTLLAPTTSVSPADVNSNPTACSRPAPPRALQSAALWKVWPRWGGWVLTPQPGQQCRQSMGWAKGWGLFLLQRVSKTFSSFPSWITSSELEEKAVHDSFLPQLFACVGLSALRAVCVVPQHRSADQQNCCTPVNTQGRTYKQASGIQAFSNLIWRIHFVITSPPCPFKIKHLLKKGRSLEAGGYV